MSSWWSIKGMTIESLPQILHTHHPRFAQAGDRVVGDHALPLVVVRELRVGIAVGPGRLGGGGEGALGLAGGQAQASQAQDGEGGQSLGG